MYFSYPEVLAALQRRCISQQPLRKNTAACRGLPELERYIVPISGACGGRIICGLFCSSSDEVKRVFDLDMTSEVWSCVRGMCNVMYLELCMWACPVRRCHSHKAERSKAKIDELICRFQQRPGDTGSTPVQSKLTLPLLCLLKLIPPSPPSSCHPDIQDQAPHRAHEEEQKGCVVHHSTHYYDSCASQQDYCCQRSLVKMVHQRRTFLQYLRRKDYPAYRLTVTELELRAPKDEHYPSRAV